MIRKFQTKDIEQVMKLWLEGNMQAHNFIPKDYWLSQYSLVQNQILQADIYVYEREKMQGFVGMAGTYLAGIFVDKAYRSMGIGKSLLEYVKERYPVFSLHVYQQNQRAVDFYQREGLLIAARGVEEQTKETEYLMKWNRK